MKTTIPLLTLALLLCFCSQEKKLARKAANSVERSDFDKAVSYYDQILQKNQNSFFGNAGKGIVLSEFMGRHEQAIPYLETARKNSPDKTKPILNSNLGKSYHFVGNFERALFYYKQYEKDNDPSWADYDEFLSKRIADCRYAMEHPKIALPEQQSIKNVGNTINTDMPEYTPVYASGNLIFTSKRKDDPNEKKNGIDGKYFEAIYISKLENGVFSKPEHYKLHTPAVHLRRSSEAIVSVSHDGTKLFVYKDGKLYEEDATHLENKPEKMDKTINFNSLQNSAALSPDGKTLYFSNEGDNGPGGTDIYVSEKGDDGKWSDPKLLDYAINTPYDEDAPFVNENGDLFFASNGHPGYGGFDIYKTKKVNGSWIAPENLGQPINSPGDDIYFALKNNSSNGYYASARPGGYGDLDIYEVHYVLPETTPCQSADSLLTITAVPDMMNPLAYNIQLQVPEQYKNNVRTYRWEVNGEPVAETNTTFKHTFTKPDDYKVSAQLVVYCDTCPKMVGMCAEKDIYLAQKGVAGNSANETNENAVASNEGANNSGATRSKHRSGSNKKGSSKSGQLYSNTTTGGSNYIAQDDNTRVTSSKEQLSATNNSGNSSGEITEASAKNEKNSSTGKKGSSSFVYLGDDELKSLHWNISSVYFDYNDYSLREDAKAVLDQNIEVLKNKDNIFININGYSDSRGTEAYNKALSAKRVNAVKQYLISKGISSKKIQATHAHGESSLVNNCTDGSNCDESQHQLNRRVKFDVLQAPKTPGSITLK